MSYYAREDRSRAREQADGARCRSCRARVVWVVTTHRKSMPIDADPVPTGNIRMTGRERPNRYGTLKPEVEYIDTSALFVDLADEPRYVSHFATCPNAEEWRSRQGGAQ